jgi:hypothetical protein
MAAAVSRIESYVGEILPDGTGAVGLSAHVAAKSYTFGDAAASEEQVSFTSRCKDFLLGVFGLSAWAVPRNRARPT